MLVNNILYIQLITESFIRYTQKYYWMYTSQGRRDQLLVVFSIFSVNYEQICFLTDKKQDCQYKNKDIVKSCNQLLH